MSPSSNPTSHPLFHLMTFSRPYLLFTSKTIVNISKSKTSSIPAILETGSNISSSGKDIPIQIIRGNPSLISRLAASSKSFTAITRINLDPILRSVLPLLFVSLFCSAFTLSTFCSSIMCVS